MCFETLVWKRHLEYLVKRDLVQSYYLLRAKLCEYFTEEYEVESIWGWWLQGLPRQGRAAGVSATLSTSLSSSACR